MTSTDPSSIETIPYLGCGPNRLSRLELLQQQQHQQFHLATSSSCEHECNCMHHQPLGNHHHHSNFSTSNGAYSHHHNHFNHNHLNQHMHHVLPAALQQQQQQLQDGILIYNNSSTNSECNQPASNNDSSQSGCSNMIHYNLSGASQNLNIPSTSCDCAVHGQQHQQQPPHHHQRQLSEQHSLQSGRSSRLISCDENNPSGTEDGSGMSSTGMITATRASKRNL